MGQLRYIRQKPIYPLSKAQFANGGLNADGEKLVMVQKKGDLEKWAETIDGIPVYGTVITTHTNADGKLLYYTNTALSNKHYYGKDAIY